MCSMLSCVRTILFQKLVLETFMVALLQLLLLFIIARKRKGGEGEGTLRHGILW